MKTTNHTPGPWEIVGSNVFSRNGWKDIPIASPCMNPGIEQSKANAHLIASAPDMFDALQAVVDYLETFACHDEQGRIALSKAQETIAKAKGESK